MEMNVFVFFIICCVVLLGGLFVIASLMVREYVTDYVDDSAYPIINYFEYFLLIFALFGLGAMLLLLLLALMFSISEYDMSLLGMFLKSEVFTVILMSFVGGEMIYLAWLINHYSFIDIIRYRNIEYRIKGVKEALSNSEDALERLDKDIKKAEKEENSKSILRELQTNRNSISKDLEDYSIKQIHLKTVKTKLENKIRANNMF